LRPESIAARRGSASTPSTKSQGKISLAFLREAGVLEIFIERMPSMVSPGAIQFYSCFISHSHADKAFARYLFDTLQRRGIDCWLEAISIPKPSELGGSAQIPLSIVTLAKIQVPKQGNSAADHDWKTFPVARTRTYAASAFSSRGKHGHSISSFHCADLGQLKWVRCQGARRDQPSISDKPATTRKAKRVKRRLGANPPSL
jgi:hypothetical protein